MDTPVTPKKRGRPPKKPMAERHRDAITKAVANGDRRAIEKAMAQANNTPALFNQKVTDAHLEVVLVRISSGDSLKNICEDLQISAALVRRRACDDLDFGRAFSMAKMIAADHSFDQQLEVAYDMTIPAADKKIIIDVLDRRAKVGNRSVYGDKVQVEHQNVIIQLSNDDRGLC